MRELIDTLESAVIAGDTFEARLESLADVIWRFYRQPKFVAYEQLTLNLLRDPDDGRRDGPARAPPAGEGSASCSPSSRPRSSTARSPTCSRPRRCCRSCAASRSDSCSPTPFRAACGAPRPGRPRPSSSARSCSTPSPRSSATHGLRSRCDRQMARRAGAAAVETAARHLVYISELQAVADIIETAVMEVS